MNSQLMLLLTAIDGLPKPEAHASGGRFFSVASYPDVQHHKIGRDISGHVAVLLAIDPSIPVNPLPPVMLEHLSIVHAARCRVSNTDGNLESGVFTVVTCTSNDRTLVRLFITVISPLVLSLPERPTYEIAAAAIQQMIRLFQLLKKPSTRSIQGLWGEMFVIRQARNPTKLVQAWHADPFERYDFADAADRLEVKSTMRTRRSHQFSLFQLRPVGDIRAVIASVQVVRVANGLTLSQLWHEVRVIVSHDLALLSRVDRVVTSSLGRAWRRGLGSAFDEASALTSLAFFAANDIPSIEPLHPTEVTEVHFRSDLSDVIALTKESLSLRGPLFAAVSSPLS